MHNRLNVLHECLNGLQKYLNGLHQYLNGLYDKEKEGYDKHRCPNYDGNSQNDDEKYDSMASDVSSRPNNQKLPSSSEQNKFGDGSLQAWNFEV